MAKINVALAGYGAGGRIYNAPIIAAVEDFTIKTILTSNPQNQQFAQLDFPDAQIVDSYTVILEDPKIDLVVITTPNHLHKDFAEKALRANKHVVVEKPLTPSFQEAQYLTKLAKENSRILSINHNRRWDSDIRTIKKLLEQQKLGRIVEFESHFDRFRPGLKDSWKERSENPGSGILYDLGSHLIDQALWCFGPPTDVFAHLSAQREGSEVTDQFELLLLYPQLKVTLKAGMLVAYPGPRYQVLGTKGSYIKSGMDVQEEALKNGKKPNQHPQWGHEPPNIWGNIITEENTTPLESEPGDYRAFYRNIAAAIRGEQSLCVSPEQAALVVRVIELAQQSHSEKRIVPFIVS